MHLFKTSLSLVLAMAGFSVTAQTSYPANPVKLVVPLTAGSGADTAGRILAQSLGKAWKQPVVIENRPGAGGLIGTSAVVNAEPSGYTLLLQSAGYASNTAIYSKLPYDPLKSLVEVAMIGVTPYVMVTAPDSPYKSIQDIVRAAKAKPGEVAFASVGVGSSTHFAAEHFAQAAGINMLHVPYKGGPEAIQDVMAGRAAFTMASLSTALGQIKGGKLRALGLASKARSDAAPDIATIAEQGFKDFDISLWFGLWAPAGTPAAVVQKITADVARAMQDPELMAAYAKIGIQPRAMNAETFAVYVREEMKKYQFIAKEARIAAQ
jgi:tripartite-type tricarboxylate transporter receptor subunit TctC